MGEVKEPQRAMPVISTIFTEGFDVEKVINKIETVTGRALMKSPVIPFLHTTYYSKEMGSALSRRWYAFEKTVVPDILEDLKIMTNEMEEMYANENGARKINIDPGFLSLHNLVLASTKNFSHRIYLGRGIYGEVTLMYKNNRFLPLEWTFPDYKEKTAIRFFSDARKLLKSRLEAGKIT